MNTHVRDSFVDVPGGRVFVRHWSRSQNSLPPIILLHDSLGSVELWRHFPEALAKAASRDVIVYDRLGFGRSSPRNELPSSEFITEEAEIYFPALQTALGISRFALFGHSVGGGMSLAIASRNPGCEAVISESAQAFIEPHTLVGVSAAKKQFADLRKFERLTKWHGEKARWVLDAWTEVWLSPAFASWSLDEYLGDITCPVLAIHGDADEFGTAAFPQRIVSKVKGPSEIAVLEDCGHVPHREKQNELLRLTVSFLKRYS